MKFKTVNKWFLVICLMVASGICHADELTTEIPASRVQAQPDWQSIAQEVLMSALSLTGVRYAHGGISPETGFDCSGFVRYVFQQASNLTLPHGARALSQLGQAISVDQLQPGDLVFFNTLKTAFSHVGIYIGDNHFIHAPTTGGGVKVVSMSDDYWVKHFNGARRIVPPLQLPPAGVSAE
jgi:cell wall-associated NlpC family hydrolase